MALALLLTQYPAATVTLEAGTHSPWISRYLTGLGATVIVANPRKLQAISRHERKCDRRDAVMLARLARADAALLGPLPARHRPGAARSAGFEAARQPGAHAGDLHQHRALHTQESGTPGLQSLVRSISQKHFDRSTGGVSAGGGAGAGGAGPAHRTNQNPGTRSGDARQTRLSRHPATAADCRRGAAHRAVFCVEDRRPRAVRSQPRCGALPLASVRAATRAGARTSHCASANAVTGCCEDYW